MRDTSVITRIELTRWLGTHLAPLAIRARARFSKDVSITMDMLGAAVARSSLQ